MIFGGPQFAISNARASRVRLLWRWSATARNQFYQRYKVADEAMLKESAAKLAAFYESEKSTPTCD